jgi:hypothetical protein
MRANGSAKCHLFSEPTLQLSRRAADRCRQLFERDHAV